MLIRLLFLVLLFVCFASCRWNAENNLFEKREVTAVKSENSTQSYFVANGGKNSAPFTYDGKQRIDILTPSRANGSKKLFVTIHSGGFLSGSRKNPIISKYSHDLAASGYYVANVDYQDAIESMSFSREKIIFTAVSDVDKAIRKAVSILEPQNVIDRDSIILLGYSAGAIVALSMGYTDREELKEYFKDTGTAGFDNYLNSPYKVSGVIALAGAMMDSNCLDAKELSSCPLLMMHGDRDSIVSPQNARPFERFVSTDYVVPLDLITGEAVVTAEVDQHQGRFAFSKSVSLTIPKEWKTIARDMLVKNMAGSLELIGKCDTNAQLIYYEGEGSDHTFMVYDGRYLNANYDDSFGRILKFASQ